MAYQPPVLPPRAGPYNTDIPDRADFTPDELMKAALGQYYHAQSPIAGHIFELFHAIGSKNR